MAGRPKKLEQQKIGLDALFKMDANSAPFAMITEPFLMGARIEYVDVSDKAAIEEWVRRGSSQGGIGATQRRQVNLMIYSTELFHDSLGSLSAARLA